MKLKKNDLINVCLFMMLLFGCESKTNSSNKVYDFMLNDIYGKRFYLSSHLSKPVLLNFWSIHCIPCIKEMPELQGMSLDFDDAITVVGICVDPENDSYVRELAEKLSLSYPVLLDLDQSIKKQFNVTTFPTTVIIDSRGKVIYRSTGFDDESIEEYRTILRAVVYD